MEPVRLYERESEQAATDLSRLNAEQMAAATFGTGPLLIVAGAGTGKTRTLVHRVAHLIRSGTPPERILLLTFTRRAAREMLERAARLVGNQSRQVHGGTFHATAHRLLRRFGQAAGLDPGFTIIDQEDTQQLLHICRAEILGQKAKEKRFPKSETLQHIYSRHVNTDISVADILAEEFPRFADLEAEIKRIFAAYTRRKQERNLLDYDDLLLFWCALVETPGELAEQIRSLYDHLLVDEYQDTNTLQARILSGMCSQHLNITAVGDDAQSIYSFRGASFLNILDFPRRFPGTTIVALEQNYRSTQPILDSSNIVISRASRRYTKNLWTRRQGGERPWLVTTRDEQEQTRFVVERVLELHEGGIPLGEIAVLFRAAYMSADLEIELAGRRIPYEKWGGLRFLEAAHIKDVLAFLRIAENPRDELSWYRVLLLLPGIGESTARQALEALAASGWSMAGLAAWEASPRARPAQASLRALLGELFRSSGGRPGEDIARIRTIYDDILRQRYDRPEPRLADLDQLQAIATSYPNRQEFLSAITLEPPQSTQDLALAPSERESDALILSTVHSAKGKEWDAVLVIWAVDGWFPLARSLANEEELEEERRLMYVAMTRARHHLAIVCPMAAYSSHLGAQYSIDQISRFLDEEVRQSMERIVPRFSSPEVEATEVPLKGPDLRDMMRRRFPGS
jgi:DNA helicase-2/ATP-dependent DNA helicase PcrA